MESRDRWAVEIDDLVKNFGNFTAVDHVSLKVKKGEIFGFLGPNGAGKSTTIRMLCGILAPTSGQGRVGGFDIYEETEKIKQNIGYMSQKFSLYEDLTVEENIDFYSGIYCLPREIKTERKEWALQMAGLEERRTSLTHTLAGGSAARAIQPIHIHQSTTPYVITRFPRNGVGSRPPRGCSRSQPAARKRGIPGGAVSTTPSRENRG
jgi:ABC-2 type transport system ATP-binding protein